MCTHIDSLQFQRHSLLLGQMVLVDKNLCILILTIRIICVIKNSHPL